MIRKRGHDKFKTQENEATPLHNVDFFISTSHGLTVNIGKKLLKRKEVLEACACIGEPSIDLRVKVILKDDLDILNMLEDIKGMEGVRDAIWNEVIEVIGRKE